jgi:hypothetical protein
MIGSRKRKRKRKRKRMRVTPTRTLLTMTNESLFSPHPHSLTRRLSTPNGTRKLKNGHVTTKTQGETIV